MCAYAIRLARVSVVVSGARASDASSSLNAYTVLSDASILPSHPAPLSIRDVLELECRAVLANK
jgi:tRNA(Arg) A34 adenosine deaminase TadA